MRLSKKVMVVAGDALRSNMTRLGPLVLPVAEQFKFLMNMVGRKMTTGSLPLPTRMSCVRARPRWVGEAWRGGSRRAVS